MLHRWNNVSRLKSIAQRKSHRNAKPRWKEEPETLERPPQSDSFWGSKKETGSQLGKFRNQKIHSRKIGQALIGLFEEEDVSTKGTN